MLMKDSPTKSGAERHGHRTLKSYALSTMASLSFTEGLRSHEGMWWDKQAIRFIKFRGI